MSSRLGLVGMAVAGALAASAPAQAAPAVSGLMPISSRSPFAADDCGVPGERNPDSEGEPSLAVNPRDARNLIAVWQQDRFTIDGGALSDVVGVSKDGGRTWKQVLLPGMSRCTGGADERTSDPWVSFGPDGRAYLSVLTFTEHKEFEGRAGPTAQRVTTSTDGGLTWSQPATIVNDNVYDDREAVTADPTRPGTAYIVWVRRLGAEGEQGVEYFSSTSDGGRTWSSPTAITTLTTGTLPDPALIKVFPDGTLLNVYVLANATPFLPAGLPRKPWDIMASRSTDGGKTWSDAVKVTSIDPPSAPQDPDSGAVVRAYNMASLDIAPDGTAYVAWNVIPSMDSSQILFSKSIDGGRSWSAPGAVANVPSQAFIPSLAVGGDGTVGVYWDDFRGDRRGDGQLTTGVFYALSKDGGASWRQGQLAGPFDTLTAPPTDSTSVAGRFLGDYQAIAGLPDGGIATVFAQAKPQATAGGTDVFFARIGETPKTQVRKLRLALSVRPKRVRADTRRRYRCVVRAGGKPLVGAKVKFAGVTHRTNARGLARFRVKLRRPGRFKVRALARGYVGTSLTVRAR